MRILRFIRHLTTVFMLIVSMSVHAQDTTRRALPFVESMLEEAGEDRIGASVFLDDIEREVIGSPFSHARHTIDPLSILNSSPYGQNVIASMNDSSDNAPKDIRYFPLSSEARGSIFHNARITLRSTLENSFAETRAMREHKWDGAPFHSVQRLEISSPVYSAGFLIEHDRGEQFANGLAVGYAAINDVGVISRAIAGMFTVNAGEGLVLARSTLFSKGTISIAQTKKYGATLSPYLSRDEFHYYRGAAATIDPGPWEFSAFISHRPLPATADDAGVITSFFTSGLFRSEKEISKFNAVTEKSAGVIASVSPASSASLTFTAVASQYDKPLAVSSPYAFGGETMKAAGVAFTLVQLPVSIFGEIAGHDLHSISGIIGTVYKAAPNFSFAVNLRSYSDNYNNPFAHAFGERGIATGERGVYFGFDWNVSKLFGLFSYVDHFSITDPELFTKHGVEYLLRADGLTAKRFTYSAQIKYKTRSIFTTPENTDRDVLDDHRQSTLRCMLRYTSTAQYTLTERINLTRVSYGISPHKEKGMLAATDLSKHFRSLGLTIKAGVVFFDTDSYDSGLSMYEPDVRGAASTSMLFGQGMSMFAMGDYAPSGRFRFSFKYGIISKWNDETLGSGDDEILGNTDPVLTIQAEISL